MKKEKEKETRTSIVQVILDDYEHGDTDWRKYPNQGENDGKRSIRIVQALYDEIGKTELNRQVLELQARHLLQDGKGQKIRPADLETMDQSVYWGVGKRPGT